MSATAEPTVEPTVEPTAEPTARPAVDVRESLAERLIADMLASLETHAIYLGVELGLYGVLHESGPCDADRFAALAGIHPRYAREWLEQQAAAGIVAVVHRHGPLQFALPAPHAEVLVDPDSPFNVTGGARMLAGVAKVLERLPTSYRTGGGIPYADFGSEIRHGIADFNRPMFLHDLGSTWLPAVAEIHERLSSPTPARVLDLGCGAGASTIAIATAYPNAEVVGVDLDEASIAEATAAADRAGVGGRVRFVAGDAAEVAGDDGSYDVVTVFEALHDMGDPVGALRAARSLLAPGGGVLVADDGVGDAFTGEADLAERFHYGWSVLHCLPATLAERPVEANGTVLRPETMRRWAGEAGYGRFAVVDLEHPFWLFYHLSD